MTKKNLYIVRFPWINDNPPIPEEVDSNRLVLARLKDITFNMAFNICFGVICIFLQFLHLYFPAFFLGGMVTLIKASYFPNVIEFLHHLKGRGILKDALGRRISKKF